MPGSRPLPIRVSVTTIKYIEHEGTEHVVDVPDGLSVMEGAVRYTVPGIDGDCGGGSEDGFLIGGAWDLGSGAGEAEDELAVASRAGDMLEELEGDVRGVEVREDQDIGAATGFSSRGFDFGRGGQRFGIEPCRIGIHLSIDHK